MNGRILLVEDDGEIAAFIKKGLQEESFSVDIVEDAYSALSLFPAGYDILLLDIMLSGMDGIALCRKLREEGIKTPVLMLTAVDTVKSKVESLECGADDYLTKPFAFEELLARVRALLRRTRERSGEERLGSLKMDLYSRRVFLANREIALTPKEFHLLEYLLKNRGRPLPRAEILEKVWGYTFDPGTNVIDVHIRSLREKIHEASGSRLIHTVKGIGYLVKADDVS
jgi:two-component system, OmpR family, copper resistance phosphate regulon response regulator CusR